MNFKPCPTCGNPLVQIDSVYRCLHCCRAVTVQQAPLPPRYTFSLRRNAEIAQQAHKNLLNNIDDSKSYCLRRGITEYTIYEWGLGYIPDNFTLLKQEWHKRIIFPIRSNDGHDIIGFGGRKTVADDRAKYINSPASPWYNKSESLYGYHNVPENADTVYLCEGYIDVLSMDAKGFAYPVASLGTALTAEQALLIRKKAQRVVVCYDADEAGQKNALRAIDLLAKAGFKTQDINVLVVRDAKDVDEALQHGCTLCEQSLPRYLEERQYYDIIVDALINT